MCCHFTVPVSLFTERHTAVLSESKETVDLFERITTVDFNHDEHGISKQFSVRPANLVRAVNHVMKMLALPEQVTSQTLAQSDGQRNMRDESEHGITGKPMQRHLTEEEQTKRIQCHDFFALKSLLGEEFQRMFTVIREDGDQVEIKCNTPPAPEQMISRMESLRREEMHLVREDVSRLGQPFNTRSDGVDALILPVPEQGKVIIFTFDYTALSRARHVVNVRLGKVKVTARSKRRFDSASPESGVSSTNQLPPNSLGDFSPHAASCSNFTTKSGIKVSVYMTDITKLPVDAIVNAANEQLSHGGGVAFAIARAAGFDLEDEGQEYIRRCGPLKVTEVAVTTGGSLPCKKVLHAVGPRWLDYEDKSFCGEHLTQTVFNCLKTAHEQGFASLAVSSISSGKISVRFSI